ncbi:MAG: D-alanyl-D-alanine carboxypeptidase/D-alanyl-D-alanine-endopeptidase [Bdellovibrionota bacterium]
MKHLIVVTIFLISLPLMTLAQSSLPSAEKMQLEKAALEKIVRSGGISMQDLGIVVMKEGAIVYENQSQQKFIPASLSKILTAIAALKTFSPEQRNITELRTTASVKDGVLDGALYIKGYGDPSFISEQMWVLVNNLTRSRITKIKGPIYVDSTVFDDKFFDGSRQSLRVDRAYDSPVSGLSFNWNTVNVYVRSSEKVGQPLKVIIDPENEYFTLVNKTTTVSGSKPAAIIVDKQEGKDGEKIIVSGSMGINQNEAVKFASVTHPDLWVGKNLLQFLKQRGITVEDSKISSQKTPGSSTLLAEAKGWTFFEVIDGMMKFSNNFLAEMLTKNIAASKGKQGSIEKGVELIKEVLETNYDLKKSRYDFFSPSGFSNKNKITPEDLGTLMFKAHKDFSISSYFLSSMAAPQSEGTLSKRMGSLKEPKLVRAKTGLLSGVTGLAGYAANSKGEVFTFVFVYNGNGKEVQARDLFDKIAVNITGL